MKTESSPRRTVALTLATLLVLDLLFAINHLGNWNVPEQVRQLDAGLGEHRAVLMILEGIAAAVLFVDMVTRFDELHSKLRAAHVGLVALAVIGFLAQIFVFFLDSALSL